MIHIEVKFLEELYYPSLTPIFEFRDKNDEQNIFYSNPNYTNQTFEGS